MDRHVLYIFSTLLVSTVTSSPNTSKQYRNDYEYNPKTNAFYKLHIESTMVWIAMDVCEMEGGQLIVPASKQDIMQVHAMMKRFPDLGEFVLVGDDKQDHEEAIDQPIIYLEPTTESRVVWRDEEQCLVVTRRGEIQKHSCYLKGLPFVCKVEAKDAPYDDLCGVYALGYEYFATVGSCYKIPRVAYSWDAAYEECLSEGAHLVILNSKAEHDAVLDLIRTTSAVPNARAKFFFFAGIRANRPKDGSSRVFRTVFNQTLQEAGFEAWSEGEPNNYMGTEYCGTIFKNDGNYNDIECSHLFGFICEKEVHE